MVFVLGLLGLVITFFVIYTAVRMAVADAIKSTVREDLLLPMSPIEMPRPFTLDAGDELDA
jgi:hypothetical protein